MELHPHDQFTSDMNEAGYDVQPYSGRFQWHGPAVVIEQEEFQSVIRATKVRLQSDQLGKGLIVYPVARRDTCSC